MRNKQYYSSETFCLAWALGPLIYLFFSVYSVVTVSPQAKMELMFKILVVFIFMLVIIIKRKSFDSSLRKEHLNLMFLWGARMVVFPLFSDSVGYDFPPWQRRQDLASCAEYSWGSVCFFAQLSTLREDQWADLSFEVWGIFHGACGRYTSNTA